MSNALSSPGFRRSPLPILIAAGDALRRGLLAAVEVWSEIQRMRHEMRRRYPRVWQI